MNEHTVSLREFIERVIAENNLRRDDLRSEDRRWVDSIVGNLEKKFDASVVAVNDARQLQATEYERRLTNLNHAHEEAKRVLNTYVTINEYKKDKEDFTKLERRVDVELADRAGKGKALPLVLSIVSIALSVFVAVAVYLK